MKLKFHQKKIKNNFFKQNFMSELGKDGLYLGGIVVPENSLISLYRTRQGIEGLFTQVKNGKRIEMVRVHFSGKKGEDGKMVVDREQRGFLVIRNDRLAFEYRNNGVDYDEGRADSMALTDEGGNWCIDRDLFTHFIIANEK